MFINRFLVLIFTNLTYAKLVNFYENCFSIPQSICLNNASQVIMSDAVPQDLQAYWSFNHLYAGFRPGPPFGGIGASAYIFPNHQSVAYFRKSELQSKDLTIMFWLYVLSDFKDQNIKENEKFVILSLNNLHVSISGFNQSVVITNGMHSLYSQATILPQRWSHIALTVTPDNQTLYINGMQDKSAPISEAIESDTTVFKIGIKKETEDYKGIEAYIDEVKVYNIALTSSLINGSIPPQSGLLSVDFIKYGCYCSSEEASNPKTCGEGYHLCYESEFKDLGYSIARNQGFLRSPKSGESLRMWFGDRIKEYSSTPLHQSSNLRLALCCHGHEFCARPYT